EFDDEQHCTAADAPTTCPPVAGGGTPAARRRADGPWPVALVEWRACVAALRERRGGRDRGGWAGDRIRRVPRAGDVVRGDRRRVRDGGAWTVARRGGSPDRACRWRR